MVSVQQDFPVRTGSVGRSYSLTSPMAHSILSKCHSELTLASKRSKSQSASPRQTPLSSVSRSQQSTGSLEAGSVPDPQPPPKIVVVARRMLRKGKWVDFVGEYHLNLIRQYGGMPIVLPRLPDMAHVLDGLGTIHGVLLVEGEDLEDNASSLSHEQRTQVLRKFASDTARDPFRDELELHLCRICIEKGIPFLGICRGSQAMNRACGGKLYYDVSTQLGPGTTHLDLDNYDGHRHGLRIVPNTPLSDWMHPLEEIQVNSYHHQGIMTLAARFRPMAYAPDGLLEGFYDPSRYDPPNGRFLVGLQFHPERMVDTELATKTENTQLNYQYEGCTRPFEDFVTAAAAFLSKSDAHGSFQRAPTVAWIPKRGMKTSRCSLFSYARQTHEEIRVQCAEHLDNLKLRLAKPGQQKGLLEELSKLQTLVHRLEDAESSVTT